MYESYNEKIGSVITNMSNKTRILYIESDNTTILDELLLKESGCAAMRVWLGLENGTDKEGLSHNSLEEALNAKVCMPLLDIYQNKGSHGRLENKTSLGFPIISTPNEFLFFYIENADAFEDRVLSMMLQAFLESRHTFPKAKLVLTGTLRNIPSALAPQIQLVRLGVPSESDIHKLLESALKPTAQADLTFTQEEIETFSKRLHGLSHWQLENIFSYFGKDLGNKLKYAPQELDNEIWRQKKLESEKDDTLTYERIEEDPHIVGNGRFNLWMNRNLPFLADPQKAAKLGNTPPKGVLFSGVPGTGKTQLAKKLAYQWGHYKEHSRPVSYISFNLGKLSSDKYGASEAKLEQFLSLLEDQAPALVMFDEIEKVFYKQKDGKSMHEVKLSQMSRLLGWMQENKKNIFFFMTCNDITALPDELIRSKRLDKRFFTFLPSYTDLTCMLYSFLHKRNHLKLFDDKFTTEIGRIYEKINEHSRNYGNDKETNKELDDELYTTVSNSSLGSILNDLAEYAKHPNGMEAEPKKKGLFSGKQNDYTRALFLTGADLEQLTDNTISRLESEKSDSRGQWTAEDFKKIMLELCCRPEFMPTGQTNMNGIVRLFLGCNDEDVSANPVVPKYQFDMNTGRFNMAKDTNTIVGTNPEAAYDKFMQEILIREIEQAAKKQQ